ncbi:BUD22-domain-containing protein, partial [Paraphysoderma sedebokerense]
MKPKNELVPLLPESEGNADGNDTNSKIATDEGDSPSELTELQRLKQEKIQRKMFHLKKELHQVSKKAKAFETQKLVKKLKSLRKDLEKELEEVKKSEIHDEITKIEQSFAYLKTMDLHKTTDIWFQSTLKKHRILATYCPFDIVPSSESSSTEPSGTSTDTKIQRKEVKTTSSVEPPHSDDDTKSSTTDVLFHNLSSRMKNTKVVKEMLSNLTNELLKTIAVLNKDDEQVAALVKANGGLLKRKRKKIQEGDSSTIEINVEKPQKKQRLGISSKDKKKKIQDNFDITSASSLFIDTLNTADSDIEIDSDMDQINIEYSYSDISDVDRSDYDSEDGLSKGSKGKKEKKKKNRLGQRARRLLNEQKYGKDAKHIEQERLTNQRRGNAKTQFRSGTDKAFKQTTRRKEQSNPTEPTDEELHPSWAAKKREKDLLKSVKIDLSGTAGANKNKIVFDSDD